MREALFSQDGWGGVSIYLFFNNWIREICKLIWFKFTELNLKRFLKFIFQIFSIKQHVNQETNWETPGSPEQGVKSDSQGNSGNASGVSAPMWKPNINNGTDLWEANLRNGGQPPAQPQNKTPWNHTPSTNLG